MLMSASRPLAATLLSMALAVCCNPAVLAQTQPAKPAAKPAIKPAAAPAPAAAAAAAAADKTLGSGGAATAEAPGAPRKPILTRDELRACFADEAGIRDRLAKIEAERAPLETGKQAIAAEQTTFREERTALDKRQRDATEALNIKFRAFAAKVETSNARVLALNESKRTGAAAERERGEQIAERVTMEKERESLEAEKTRVIAELQAAVDSFNGSAGTLDKRIVDWNQRNAKTNDQAGTVEAERKDWLTNCSNRRYREDDETAIKAGK